MEARWRIYASVGIIGSDDSLSLIRHQGVIPVMCVVFVCVYGGVGWGGVGGGGGGGVLINIKCQIVRHIVALLLATHKESEFLSVLNLIQLRNKKCDIYIYKHISYHIVIP